MWLTQSAGQLRLHPILRNHRTHVPAGTLWRRRVRTLAKVFGSDQAVVATPSRLWHPFQLLDQKTDQS